MKRFIAIFILLMGLPVFSKTISGEIKKETTSDVNKIYDSYNNQPIQGAVVKLPAYHYSTVTNHDGTFKLETKIDAPTIMSIQKDGYKPFSMSINSENKHPIIVGIEKTTPNDIIIETDMIHLGDNTFSERSANAYDFSLQSIGPFYTKDFEIPKLKNDENIFLTIGSIIGIDTMQARAMGQSSVKTSYSSPPEIFCNGNKIAEIKINGDNQKINIPKSILAGANIANITIKTGRNLFKKTDIDFDDIEFTNLLLEVK